MARWPARTTHSPHPFSGFLAVAAPLLLAGLFPLHPDMSERWGWSGSWLHPVGDPYAIAAASADCPAGYRIVRGVSERSGRASAHQGVDLSNGRGGGPVRAAGNGLVVEVGGKGWNRGYGRHVVLAHRLSDGSLVYSIYAHLAPQSVTVHQGQFVGAGWVIGRVGMSGRATSPHLHFEVRVARDPEERWENSPVVDPLAFVSARLPSPRADSLWSRPYLEWAECAALIRPGDDGAHTLSRAEWWRALLAATRHGLPAVPADGESLRAVLIGMNLLPEYTRGDPGAPLGWSELARDLRRARDRGLRLPWSPVKRDARRLDCRREIGTDSPAHDPAPFARGRDGRPSLADVCLALADFAGDAPPRPGKPGRPSPPSRPAG